MEKKPAVVPTPPPSPIIMDPTPPPPASPSPVFVILVSILIGVAGWLGYRYYKVQTPQKKEIAITTPTTAPQNPTPTPSPIVLKPDDGVKGNYSVSQGSQYKGPTISHVTFDPLDVKKGQKLTVTVTLSSPTPITSVTGTLTGDTTSMPITFTRVSTANATSIWSATLTITDTLWYKYILKLTGVNANGTSSVIVAPRS